MADIAELFGRRVRALRRKQELTQQQLGERAGVNYKYVGAIERGEQNPTLKIIEQLAKGLGLEMVDLFEVEHQERDPEVLRERIGEELEGARRDELRVALRMVRAIRR